MKNQNQIQKIKKENNQLAEYKILESQLELLLEGQEINRNELRRGFIGLATQNQELINLRESGKKKLLAKKLVQNGNGYQNVTR